MPTRLGRLAAIGLLAFPLALGISCDEERLGPGLHEGYIPAEDVERPPAPAPQALPSLREPPDPLVDPPPRDNPGGVDGDRPPRDLPELEGAR